ncbi:MAG: hypothetical protein SPI01_06095 [Succiniclasticum sp.]|nr:hypothetical protein [Succiniclasticum sp.]
MKLFRLLLLFIVLMGFTANTVSAKDNSPDICNLCTMYEDSLFPMSEYKMGTKPKGRVAVINGCCQGGMSYMTIITYWKDRSMQQALPDQSIVSLKEVRVSEILESKSKGTYLHGILTLWYGLDANGKIVTVYKDTKDKIDANMEIKNIFETRVEVWNDSVNKQTARVIDEMEFKSHEWSLPEYEIVADPEWAQYVGQDGSVILPSAG